MSALFALCSVSLLCAQAEPAHPDAPLIDLADAVRHAVVPVGTVVEEDGEGFFKIQATGFFIHEGGLLLTAAHSTKDGAVFISYENRVLPCSVVRDNWEWSASAEEKLGAELDFAVLQVDEEGLSFPSLSFSDRISFPVGLSVATYSYFDAGVKYDIGPRKMLSGLLTTGIISAAFGFRAETDEEADETSRRGPAVELTTRLVLQITAGPGSSGAPVFDLQTGKVIGIIVQGKLRKVLTPPAEGTNALGTTSVPMGIAEAEPLFYVRAVVEAAGPSLEGIKAALNE